MAMASAALNFKVREKLTGSQLTRLTAHSSLQDPGFYCYESDSDYVFHFFVICEFVNEINFCCSVIGDDQMIPNGNGNGNVCSPKLEPGALTVSDKQ